MKKIIIFLLIFLLLFLGFWYGKDHLAFISERENVIKIGAPLCLTGSGMSWAEDIRRGIEMAKEEVNQGQGFKIEIIYEDTQGDAKTAVDAVKKLLEIDKVDILIGPVRSSSVLAVSPLTEERKVILFTPIASSEDITYAGDFVFRNRETSRLHGEEMAGFLFKQGIKEVALLTAQSANSLSYAKSFRESFKGKVAFYLEYNENETDFRTDILKMGETEAIYVAAATGRDGGILVKQLRESGFEGLIVGAVTLENQDFLQSAGSASEGVVISSPSFDIEDPSIQSYREKFKELYGVESNAFSAYSYDVLKILSKAINYCEGDNTDCIKDFLYNLKNYPGAGGLTSFDENGDVVKPLLLKQVANQSFELLH